MGMVAFLVSLALISCESDAQHIRETNAALSMPTNTAEALSAKIDAIEIQDGDCIDSKIPEGIDIESVVIVPCSGTWHYRAVNSIDVADSSGYPGGEFFAQRAFESCDRRYTTYLYPTVESWSNDDRNITCLQESFGLSVADPAKLDRLVSSYSLTTGECFSDAPETDGILVELVECSGEWQSKVINNFRVAAFDRYPGEDFFAQRAFESCDRRYTTYLYPTVESWSNEDRNILCLQESLGFSVADPARLDRLVSSYSLTTGECFNDAPEIDGSLVEIVECSSEWQSKVINSFEVAVEGRHPGEDFLDQRAFEACDRRRSYWFLPTEESWEFGGRKITCIQESYGLSATEPAKLDRASQLRFPNPWGVL